MCISALLAQADKVELFDTWTFFVCEIFHTNNLDQINHVAVTAIKWEEQQMGDVGMIE